MNLATMKSSMQLMMRSNAPDFLNNMTMWINEAQRKVCRLGKWDFTETEESFSTNQQVYTLSNKYARLSVWRTSGPNSPVDLLLIDASSAALLASSGPPTHFRSPASNQIVFYPAPDTAYSFRVAGHVFLPDFVNDADENELSRVAPYVLVFGALIEAALHLGRDPSLWKARFEEELVDLRNSHEVRGRGAG